MIVYVSNRPGSTTLHNSEIEALIQEQKSHHIRSSGIPDIDELSID